MSRKIAKKSFHYPILLLLLMTLVVGCGGPPQQPTESAQIVVPTVEVVPSGALPEKRTISTETIPQNNCSGSTDISNTIGHLRAIVYELEVGEGILVSDSGNADIPGIGKVQVGAEVAAHYGVTYRKAESLSHLLTLSAKAGTHMQHTLQQVEYWETGELIIVAGEKTLRYPYSFRKDFGIELVKSENVGCPLTSNPAPTQTPVPPTATATHTPVPPTATATHTPGSPAPTPAPTATPQLTGPIALTIYLRHTLTETGFAALSGDQPNGGMIYKEGNFVYGEAAVQIGDTVYHFDKPEVGPGEPEQLPDPWRVEFEFAEALLARTGNAAGFDPKKAQFWVGALDSHSAVGEESPYSLTMKLYEENELRESIQVFFAVEDAPESPGPPYP
jgi:cell division septation protein DedD